jgi:hypothetical protein
MSLFRELIRTPFALSIASKYTAMNGVLYLVLGSLLALWPDAVQQILRDPPFQGHERQLARVIGMNVGIIGWLYLFGGTSGARQIVAASVVDRLIFVPLILIPLAWQGTFPHLLLSFAILDPVLGIGAWILLSRSPLRGDAGAPQE